MWMKTKKFKKGYYLSEMHILRVILVLGVVLASYPHWNYPYPLHVDEWFHIAEGKMVAQGAGINWYSGQKFGLGMERAWHVTLGLVQKVLGLNVKEWMIFPAVMHAFAILSVFYFVKKMFGSREALVASFLTALMPSNVTMGGPVMLVPVNLSLIFIPLGLVFLFGLAFKNDWWNS